MNNQLNLSQLKSEEIRTIIPAYVNNEHIADVKIYNPTIEYMKYIKTLVVNNAVNDELKIDMIKTLTDINVDCELDESFFKYYNELFTMINTELDLIIFDITTDYAMEMYSFNKLSPEKQAVITEMMNGTQDIIKSVELKEEEKKKQHMINEAEAEIKLAQEKLDFLRGEGEWESYTPPIL